MWWWALVTGCVVTEGGTGSTVGEPGTVSLTWSVGALGCEDAGVVEVEVALGQARERIACKDGGAEITASPGRYDVVATGFDADGNPRYEGTTDVHIDEGGTSTAHLTLSALPSALEVTWFFENGRLCAANGVTDVDLTLFDEDDYVVAESTLPCDEGFASLEELRSGTFGLLLEALDDDGALAFRASTEVTLDKGDGALVELELAAP